MVAAIRRRTGSVQIAKKVKEDLLSIKGLVFLPLDGMSAQIAADIAAETGVRGMDALVIQVAKESDAPLVSLDEELCKRAGKVAQVKAVDNLV